MLLQERIEELNSVIIDIYENKIKLTGFLSEERLLDFYERGSDCRFSIGLYPKEDFDIAYTKDNSLIIIMDQGNEIQRYKFVPIKKYTINYKDIDNKNKSRVITIRQCYYTKKYNYRDTEKSILFDSETELKSFCKDEYNYDLIL